MLSTQPWHDLSLEKSFLPTEASYEDTTGTPQQTILFPGLVGKGLHERVDISGSPL